MDDYTLFSRRRLVPYGQSYAPDSSSRFEQGAMRIKQMERAQERAIQSAMDLIAQNPNARTMLAEGLARNEFPRLPDADANADMPNVKVKSTLRAENLQPRGELPSWFANKGVTVAPLNIGNESSATLPSFAYARRLDPIEPESPVTRALAAAKGLYRAATSPAATAKAVANAVLSGEDYQSSGEPVVQNGVINWGDPDNSADFFRADQALQEMHPYVEQDTVPEPAEEGYADGGIVSGLLNEVVDFVNPGFADGGPVEDDYGYDYEEPLYVEEDFVPEEEIALEYVEPVIVDDLEGFAEGGPVLLQDEYPTEYMPEVGRQVMAGGGPAENYPEDMIGVDMTPEQARARTAASIQPRQGEEVRVDGEGWQRVLQNYRNFPASRYPATMRARDDWRANAAAFIAGEGGPSYGSELRRRAGEALFGSTYGVGLTDVFALPTILDAAQAYRKGNTGEATINAATLGIPFAAAARKPIANALRAARDVITSPAGRNAAAGAAGAAVMSPYDAEAANVLRALSALSKGSAKKTAEKPLPKGMKQIIAGTPENDTLKAQEAYKSIVSPFSSDPASVQRALQIASTYRIPQGAEFGTGSFFTIKPPAGVQDVRPNIGPLSGVTPLEPRNLSWEDFAKEAQGGTMINVGGDRMNLGTLRDINDEKRLAWDVPLHAGPKYMLEPNPGMVWANAPGHTTSFNRIIGNAAKEGPVYGVYAPMGPTAVDSSVDMFNAVMSQIPTSKISKVAADNFDEIIRNASFVSKVEDRPRVAELMKLKWPGISNLKTPEEVLALAQSLTGTQRGDLVKAMDKATRRKEGFPDIGATRVAVTDPALLSAPSNTIGHRIVRFDTEGLVSPERKFSHPSYPSESIGTYVGDVPLVQTQYGMPTAMDKLLASRTKKGEVMHPYSVDAMGRSSARKMFTEQKQLQPVNDRLIESIMMGLERQKKYGLRKGGSVSHRALMVGSSNT